MGSMTFAIRAAGRAAKGISNVPDETNDSIGVISQVNPVSLFRAAAFRTAGSTCISGFHSSSVVSGKTNGVAKLVVDPKSLPNRAVPIPGAKPPVFSLPYQDPGHPGEVDEFRKLLRNIRRQVQTRPK